MPPYSTLRTFIDSLKSGETNITRCVESVANNDPLRRQHEDQIRTPNSFDGALPNWLRNAFAAAGMKPEEVEHVESWPDGEKETVRQQIAHAMDDGRSLIFRWEVHPGGEPKSTVARESSAEALVVFQSPRSGVHLSTLTFGAIHVEA